MDDYSFQQELEALAGNAYNPDPNSDSAASEPISKTADRWQSLFGQSSDDAVERIMAHRNNLTRTRISDALWETVRTEKEDKGYDREAYEYELELQKKKATLPELLSAPEDESVTYLVELTGPLDTPEKVQRVVGLVTAPEVVIGRSVEQSRPVKLCSIDGPSKTALLRWAAGERGGFEPTILVDPRSLQ